MIGHTVAHYRIVEEIGRGAMAVVFKALDTASDRLVALKIMVEKLVDNPEMLHRFDQEGKAASSLHHPNICTVFESGGWQGRRYIAMELLTGETLGERLGRGPMPADQLIAVGSGVTSALEATHALGIVHRDIKPANIFLTVTGEVKVLDFGLAKVRAPTRLNNDATVFVTRPGMLLGTVAYMSPEQSRCEALDGRADLYSLGVVLYELATGKLPDRRSADTSPLPAGLGSILARLLSPDAAARYQTAAEAREAFQRCGTRSAEAGAARKVG